MSSVDNKYTSLTCQMLGIEETDSLIAKNGFEHFIKEDEKCVLIMGLNPAGDEKDVDFEKSENYFHLRYIDNEKLVNKIKKQEVSKDKDKSIKRFYYPNYFKPIYEMVKSVFGNNIKWDYANRFNDNFYINSLKKKILNEDCVKEVIDYLKTEAKKEISICTGELFYYHKTSSNELEKMYTKNVCSEYIFTMLDYHIEDLKSAELQFVYINNGKASKLIYEALENKNDYLKSYSIYKGIPIFYGGMLSNGVTDTFSKNRLVNEIRAVLNIEN